VKLHEHQSKEIFREQGVPVPQGVVVTTPEAAADAARRLGTPKVAVKAQVLAGGRGKGGGVRIVDGPDGAEAAARDILGSRLVTAQTGEAGVDVHKVLIEEGLEIESEFYMSITLDRGRECHLIMASSEGGVEIETVARERPEKIIKEWVDPAIGLKPFQTRRMAVALGLGGERLASTSRFITSLWDVYRSTDANLVEVNPMVLTRKGDLVALDGKIDLDDSALFRHPDLARLRDVSAEPELETLARENRLNYIKLDGSVGCMVNGAGLAMATMDLIQLHGGMPANFLDVGGGASADQVAAAFRILMADEDVQAVLINIFGGILRCDRLASGVVEAAKAVEVRVPVVVRLEGTNVEEGRRILEESHLPIRVAQTMSEGARLAIEATGGAQ